MGEVADSFGPKFLGQTLLGRYRIDRELAEGGMGAVFVAHDTNLDRTVVVKAPHPRMLADPGFRKRFLREVEELRKLEHPHIVRILDKGEHNGLPFVVLQYLGGGSLADRVKGKTEGLPLAEVRPWLRTVAATLDFIHGKGIVHRDVKPANIMFDDLGNVFLSDFGVAKSIDAPRSELTGTGMMIGSPAYMAPEQALGRKLSGATDQYSLGLTLYHVFAGHTPFDKGTPVELLLQKQRGSVKPLHQSTEQLPRAAADCIMRAMSNDPASRHETCVAFVDAFEDALKRAAQAPVSRRRRLSSKRRVIRKRRRR